MSFLNELEKTALGVDYNESYTENGAKGYRTTGKEILDMNFKISSYRNMSEQEIIDDFKAVFLSDKTLALQFLFYIRDREEGLGERRTFRTIFRELGNSYPGYVVKLIPVVAEYGRFDDLLPLLDTHSESKNDVLRYIQKQMVQDYKDMEQGKPISLLAKWLPSVSASSKENKKYAKMIINFLRKTDKKFDYKRYRKAVSKMRTYIDVVEKKMCTHEWGNIKYETVPSKANLIYSNAFLRHDEERRTAYLESLKKGETKINASKLFPYEIYYKIDKNDETLEQLWKNLPNMKNDTESVLVVADGSGSMSWAHLGNTNVTALDVANSLAIYFAERAKGEFKNHYITFSSRPQLVDLGNDNTLYEKKHIALRHDECSDTNIEKTFDLILETAVNGKMSQEDMPSTVLILSDMEFNSATYESPSRTLFDTIERKFQAAGYKMPRLVFWNICGRTNTIPVLTNELGVALVSGFSTTIFDMVLNNKTNPLDILLDKLNSPRYLKIKEIVESN